MRKIITHNTKGKSVELHPKVNSSFAPEIELEILNDSGEREYILANGNTALKSAYDAIWKPARGVIHPKGYKGEHTQSYQRIV